MTNKEKFIQLFLDFENIILNKNGNSFDNERVYDKLNELKNKRIYPYYSEFEFLDFCRKYRNNVVHQSLENKYLDFSDEMIIKFENIIEIIKNPEKALSKAITNIYSVNINDKVKDTIEQMLNNRYTYIPVYENNKLSGIFSKSVLLEYLLSNDLNENTTFKAFSELIKPNNSKELFIFVPKNRRFTDVVEEYIKYADIGKKLECVFITENGRNNEKILGLLTAWNIVKNIYD